MSEHPAPPLLDFGSSIEDMESLESHYGMEWMISSSSDCNIQMASILSFLNQCYQLKTIEKHTVPGRPPELHQEWQDSQQQYWPTFVFPQKSKEHQVQQLLLSAQEVEQMVFGMKHPVQDKQHLHQQELDQRQNTSV